MARHDSDSLRHVHVWRCQRGAARETGDTTEPLTNRMGPQHSGTETLSVTFEGEYVHASGTAHWGTLSWQQQHSVIPCYVRRGEGISIDALGTGTVSHVDETDVDASWEAWETVIDGDGQRLS